MRYLPNHRKCQKAHSGIVSSRQGPGQARTLARHLYQKSSAVKHLALLFTLNKIIRPLLFLLFF